MTMTLHMYRPWRFQWFWFGVNWPSGWWVLVSTRFQELSLIKPVHMPTWSRRSYDHDNAHIRAKMVPVNAVVTELRRPHSLDPTDERTNERTDGELSTSPPFFLRKWRGTKSQWNLNQNTDIFLNGNAFENVIGKMWVICTSTNGLMKYMTAPPDGSGWVWSWVVVPHYQQSNTHPTQVVYASDNIECMKTHCRP